MNPVLAPNDLIYICSPAKAIEAEHVEFASRFFVNHGFRVEISQNALGRDNYFSGTIAERLTDLQYGLDHPEAKVILCARGGYGCMQLLDHLDWNAFEKKPKHLVGFSDVTALHFVLGEKRIPSVHGTMPLNFQENTPESLLSLLAVFAGNPRAIIAPPHPNNVYGETEAEVIGGNLAMVHAMLSAVKSDLFTEKILFLEDVGEHLYQVDRMLYGLKNKGVFERISGLMIGSFTNISDTHPPFGTPLNEIVLNHATARPIPIGFGFPCGHQTDNQALVLNKKSHLLVDKSGSILKQTPNENP